MQIYVILVLNAQILSVMKFSTTVVGTSAVIATVEWYLKGRVHGKKKINFSVLGSIDSGPDPE